MPRRVVPSGIAVYMAGRAAISESFGPASSARTAAVATALVWGTSRRTGTRPALSVKLPRTKYARTMVVPAGDAVAVGRGVGVGVRVGVADGAEEGVAEEPVDGCVEQHGDGVGTSGDGRSGDGDVRSGVA